MTAPLNRSGYPATPASRDQRIVHLGLGAFHRAHQAWYTARAEDGDEWAIAAYSGRRPEAAVALAEQDGLYTLIERDGQEDHASVIDVITEAVDGADVPHLMDAVSSAATAVITLTITEAGYQHTTESDIDIRLLGSLAQPGWRREGAAWPRTVLGRLALALEARRRAGAVPIAVVSCDNLPANGAVLREALEPFLSALGPEARAYADTRVSFVSTSVDRITPRTTDADCDAAERLIGFRDECVVVSEPFSDWVLEGEFPAGRPQWETAGARFVDDIEPYERRKLWLLNGAHTLLAAAGRVHGYALVSEAIADAQLREWVEQFWDEAVRHLPKGLDLDEYRASLLARFANTGIRHSLDQIAEGAVAKLSVRIVPVLLAERAAGRDGAAALRVIAAHAVATGTAPETAEHLARSIGLPLDPPLRDDLRRSIATFPWTTSSVM